MEIRCTQRKCDGMMRKGIAMGQTYTGMGDFRQSDAVCTVSPGGSGEIIPVMKCNKCGHSVSIKEKGGD